MLISIYILYRPQRTIRTVSWNRLNSLFIIHKWYRCSKENSSPSTHIFDAAIHLRTRRSPTEYCIVFPWQLFLYIDGLMQDCSNSSALAMELLLSCTKLSIYSMSYAILVHSGRRGFRVGVSNVHPKWVRLSNQFRDGKGSFKGDKSQDSYLIRRITVTHGTHYFHNTWLIFI